MISAHKIKKNFSTFNMHQLETYIIEQIFGVLKCHFQILLLAPEYDLNVQAQIPTALCAIHNFICVHDQGEGILPGAADYDSDEGYSDQESVPQATGILRWKHGWHRQVGCHCTINVEWLYSDTGRKCWNYIPLSSPLVMWPSVRAAFFATLVILHNLFPKVTRNAARAMATLMWPLTHVIQSCAYPK